jgi:hypothetical protein
MSDQTAQGRDRTKAATAQRRSGFCHSCDQNAATIDRLIGVILTLVLTSCVRMPAAVPIDSAPATAEWWVDAFAPEGGDGSRSAAFKQVPQLRGPATLHLRSGLYRGPFVFPGETRLEGHGAVVLFDEGNEAVVSALGPLSLTRLSVQGGRVGITSGGALLLEHVRLSGHRVAGVQIIDGGVTGQHIEVTSRLDGVVGLDATNSSVALHDVNISGPLLVGVRAKDSTVTLTKLSSEGAATAVQTIGGTLELKALHAAGGMHTAVSLSKTRATLNGIDVTGHEYAVLGVGNDVQLDDLTSSGAFGGGVSFVNSTVRVTKATVQRAGPLGGVQLVGCTSVLGAVTVTASQAWGVMVRQGSASITALTATGLRLGGGDALHVRDARVTIERLNASDLEGSGIFASNFATVTAGIVDVSGADTGAIVVERKSSVTAERVTSHRGRGPALAAPEDGVLTVGSLTAEGEDDTVWADCATGSFITVKAVSAGTKLPRLRCLQGPGEPRR